MKISDLKKQLLDQGYTLFCLKRGNDKIVSYNNPLKAKDKKNVLLHWDSIEKIYASPLLPDGVYTLEAKLSGHKSPPMCYELNKGKQEVKPTLKDNQQEPVNIDKYLELVNELAEYKSKCSQLEFELSLAKNQLEEFESQFAELGDQPEPNGQDKLMSALADQLPNLVTPLAQSLGAFLAGKFAPQKPIMQTEPISRHELDNYHMRILQNCLKTGNFDNWEPTAKYFESIRNTDPQLYAEVSNMIKQAGYGSGGTA